MILYLDSSRGISAGLVLGALLDAGANGALVQRILGTVTLPRISLMRGTGAGEASQARSLPWRLAPCDAAHPSST